MPSSAELKLTTPSLELATHQLELLTQSLMDGAGSLAELQLRIYCDGGGGEVEKLDKAYLSY